MSDCVFLFDCLQKDVGCSVLVGMESVADGLRVGFLGRHHNNKEEQTCGRFLRFLAPSTHSTLRSCSSRNRLFHVFQRTQFEVQAIHFHRVLQWWFLAA
jgi:hypothetical protein